MFITCTDRHLSYNIIKKHKTKDSKMSSSTNTLKANVNELMTGYYLLGGTWKGFASSSIAHRAITAAKAKLDTQEYKDQVGRAKAMASEILSWTEKNGYKGAVQNVWWTALPGSLAEAYGKPVNSKENPSDILVLFGDGQYLGISAKSSVRKEIGFKNPGIGSIEKALNVSLSQVQERFTAQAVKQFNLPVSLKERKKYVRQHTALQAKTQKVGDKIIVTTRNMLFDRLNELDNKGLKCYLKKYWLNANNIGPRYIKVTGRGKAGNYSAVVTDPRKNTKLSCLQKHKVTLVPVGTNTIGVMAHDTKIMKIRLKYESEKLCSSIKLSGDPW